MIDRSRAPDLRAFERIVFFTGAGVSRESGIPTYRGKGGIWERFDYREVACQRAFDRDPEGVWDWHDERRAEALACEPNLAHRLIGEIQREKPATEVVTQNIDGLHQRGGAGRVIELHGSLWRVRCDREGIVREDFTHPFAERRCPCGDWWRPDIVWFEDPLDQETIRRAWTAIEGCDCLVSVGTSANVYPAAELPMVAMRAGAVTIEVNPEDTPLSGLYTHRLRGAATEMMRRLWPGA